MGGVKGVFVIGEYLLKFRSRVVLGFPFIMDIKRSLINCLQKLSQYCFRPNLIGNKRQLIMIAYIIKIKIDKPIE
jgi:hypothetical protein